MNRTILGVVVAIIIVGGAVFFMNQNKATAPTNEDQTQNQNNDAVDPNPNPTESPTPSQTQTPNSTITPNPASPTPTSTTPQHIDYTDSGFVPASVTIKKGTIVTFDNESTKSMWPASAPHPTHTDYPEFDPKKAIAPGETWPFTFTKVGTWKYHDHLNPSRFGTIIVTE
jgi:plastocyanin